MPLSELQAETAMEFSAAENFLVNTLMITDILGRYKYLTVFLRDYENGMLSILWADDLF